MRPFIHPPISTPTPPQAMLRDENVALAQLVEELRAEGRASDAQLGRLAGDNAELVVGTAADRARRPGVPARTLRRLPFFSAASPFCSVAPCAALLPTLWPPACGAGGAGPRAAAVER
jgi:hypothetical protein